MGNSAIRGWAMAATAALLASAVAVGLAPAQVGAASDYDLSAYFLSVDAPSIAPGGSASLWVTVNNEGSVATTGVATVTFTLPAGLNFLGGTDCDTPVGNQVSCRTDIPVDPQSNRTVWISVERDLVTPGLIGPITATVSGPDADPDPADNTVTNYLGEITDPGHMADLYVTADASPYLLVAGGTATLTLTVVNQGPDDAVDVVLVPTLGPGWSIVSSPAGCSAVCALGTVAAAASVPLVFTVQIAPDTTGQVSAVDNVISGTPDPNETNGSSSVFQVAPPPPPGAISGTILAGTAPIEGAQVIVINTSTWAGYSDTTDAAGDYQVTGLPSGNYTVQAQGAGFQQRFYPGVTNQMSALPVTVGAAPVADIDITYPGGSITGIVTWRGNPVEGATVSATPNVMMPGGGGASTGVDGRYTIRGLDLGSYNVFVSSPQGSGRYGGATFTPVALTAGDPGASTIDIAIPPGSISGVVFDQFGLPVNATVFASRVGGGGYGMSSVSMAGDGTFTITGLAEGDYTVYANNGMGGAPTTPIPAVVVASPTYDVTGVTLQFPAPAAISGRVDVNGLLPTTVYLSPAGPGSSAFTTTDGNGDYTFSNVAPGTYRVSTNNGMTNWYHPGVSDYMAATLVTVAGGQSLTGIDIVAPDPGTISGTVTAGTTGVGGISVRVWGNSSWWTPLASTTTAPDGTYSLSGLPALQQLRVEFLSSDGIVLGEWWNDATDRNNATPITLASGEVRDVDAVLAVAATISGQVIAADTGLGVEAQVILYRPALGSYVVLTDTDGYFTITGVVGDTYVLYAKPGPFDPSVYAPEYWGGSSSLAAATPIAIATGDQLTGYDITVEVGATISGTVTDPDDNPVAGAGVSANEPSGPPGFTIGNVQAWTGADGAYTLTGLVPGDYSVRFEPETLTGLLAEYYPNAYEATGAVPITVGAANNVTGIDAKLERGIFGTALLRNTYGPIDSGTVFGVGASICRAPGVFDAVSFRCMPGDGGQPTSINGAGGWRVGPLAPGDYNAQAVSFGSAGDVVTFTVNIGDTFSCDLAFPGAGASSCTVSPAPPTGSITGRVTGPDGLGVGGVRVQAEVAVNRALPTQVTTDASGYYEMSAVQPGSYRVRFLPPFDRTDLVEEWYSAGGGSSTHAGGDVVAVTAGLVTPGISARLSGAAAGTATVTDGSGTPLPRALGRAVVLCPAATVYDFSAGFFSCADGTPVVFGQAPSSPADTDTYVFSTIGPGEWTVRAVQGFFLPQLLGPEATFTLAEGDSFTCVLPIEGASASCIVTSVGNNDGDGILPEVEADAPNAGDGNNDGQPDSEQPDVTSLNDPDAGYVTLAVEQSAAGPSAYTLANVTVEAPQSNPPNGAVPQTSLIGFEVVGIPRAETISIEVLLPTPANQYWKYDADTDTWTDATSLVTFLPSVVIGVETRWPAVLQLTDGGAGDQDGVVDGKILDPGVWALGELDTTPPDIVCQPAQTVLLNQAGATLTATVTDDYDAPSTVTVPLSTATIGVGRTVAVNATDAAGNAASVDCTYTVGVNLTEFRDPIDPAVVNGVKAGQVVPVKWRVVDANGQPVSDPAHFTGITSYSSACATGLAVEAIESVDFVSSGLQYKGDGVWQLNWKTSKVWSGCRVLVLTVVGDTATARFKIG